MSFRVGKLEALPSVGRAEFRSEGDSVDPFYSLITCMMMLRDGFRPGAAERSREALQDRSPTPRVRVRLPGRHDVVLGSSWLCEQILLTKETEPTTRVNSAPRKSDRS